MKILVLNDGPSIQCPYSMRKFGQDLLEIKIYKHSDQQILVHLASRPTYVTGILPRQPKPS